MRISPVLLLALLVAPQPAAAQHLGAELGVVPPESGSQSVYAVTLAGDGSELVLVYTNRTTGVVSSRFAVLTHAGAVVRIPDVLLPLRSGTLACHPGECVLMSTERISMVGTTPTTTRGVFVARFRTDGTLVDSAPLTLAEATTTSDSFTPVLARTATGYLVTWREYRPTPGGSALRSAAIPLTGPADAPITHDSPWSGQFRFACHDSVCVLTREIWAGSGYSTTIERLDSSGASLGPPVSLGAIGGVYLVADSGVDFVVAQNLYAPALRWRVDYDGTIRTVASASMNGSAITCDGSGGCLLTGSGGFPQWWRADDTIVGGTVRTGYVAADCYAAGACVILEYSSGSHLLPIGFDGTTLTSGTSVRVDAPLAHAHGAHLAAANDGASHLVLFGDLDTAWRLGAALADEVGPLAGASATGLASVGSSTRAWIQRGEADYGLLLLQQPWSTYSPLHFHLLDDTGLPTFGPLSIAPSAGTAALAWNGRYYLVAWTTGTELRVQRLDAIGQRVDDAPRVVRTASFQSVEIAWDGAHWMLVTREGNVRVKAMRLEEDGTPIDAPTGVLVRDATGSGAQVAFGRGTYLAVWQDTLATTGSSQIRAARISTGGEVLDLGGRIVATLPQPAAAMDVIFDGSRFVVGWSFVDATSTTAPARLVVRARTVATDGAMGTALDVLDDVDRGLAAGTSGPDPLLALSSADLGHTLITYTRQMTSLAEAPVRVRARSFVDDSLGAGCRSGADCASGACSGGICCDRACNGACEACGFDGHCAPLEAGTICRDAAGACDAPEVCDGSAAECPVAMVADCDGGVVTMPDAGTVDLDGGIGFDGGVLDFDAGVSSDDAGALDADGGTSPGDDGGPSIDRDAGTSGDPDAGGPDPSTPSAGCACSATGAGGAGSTAHALLTATALALALARRRRRRR